MHCRTPFSTDPIACLIDSGAQASLLNLACIPENFRTNIIDSNVSIKGVTGDSLRVVGTLETELTFSSDTVIKHPFYVVQGMVEDLIIGRDLMAHNHCTISFSDLTFSVGNLKLPLLKTNRSAVSRFNLVSCQRVRLPPQSVTLIPCQLTFADRRHKNHACYSSLSGIIEPRERLFRSMNVRAENTLANFLKGKGVYCLMNTSNNEVRIYKNQVIGNVSSIASKQVQATHEDPEGEPASQKQEHERWSGDLEPLFEMLKLDKLDHLTEAEVKRAKDLIRRFKGIFSENDDDLGCSKEEHDIKLDTQIPIQVKSRQIPLHHREHAEREVNRLMKLGIIRPSNSVYHSPAFVIKKPSGDFRLICDYRAINRHVIRSVHPLPSLETVTALWNGCTMWSKMDFNSGYLQTKLSERSKRFTAAGIPSVGFFEFNRLPLGLSSAVGFFQGLISKWLLGLKNVKCCCFIDDIATGATDFDQMISNLEEVFKRIAQSGLLLKPQKCRFFITEMDFLGFRLNKSGVSINPEKTEAITKMVRPHNKKTLKSALGMFSFYRKFIKGYADIARPLTQLLTKEARFKWGLEQQQAFDSLKGKMTSPPILKYPDLTKPFILVTDASSYCIGATLAQIGDDNQQHPIAYASNVLSKSQQNWSSFQREFYALKYYCIKFRTYLLQGKFKVYTDHQALVKWQTFKDIEKPKLWRWVTSLSQFDMEVIYVPGCKNVSDGTSRLPRENDQRLSDLPENFNRSELPDNNQITVSANATEQVSGNRPINQEAEEAEEGPNVNIQRPQVIIPPQFDVDGNIAKLSETLKDEQLSDSTISLVKSWVNNKERPNIKEVHTLSPELKTYYSSFNRLSVKDGILYRSWEKCNHEKPTDLICVPPSIRPEIIRLCHDVPTAAHYGKQKTLERVQSRFYWPKMELDTNLYVDSCVKCIKKSQKRKPRSPLHPFNGTFPNDLVQMDILENLPVSNGYKSILVLIDRFTMWTECCPLKSTKVEHIARAILDLWICRHGVMRHLHSDRASNLHTAKVLQTVYNLMGIRKTATCSYRPQSDGASERFIRTIKNLLKSYCMDHPKSWTELLNQCLFAYRTTIHSSVGFSPFFLHRGHTARLPLDVMFDTHSGQLFQSRKEYAYKLHKTLKETYDYVDKSLRSNREFMKTKYDKRMNEIKYKIGDKVFVWRPRPPGNKNKFFDHWFGPYEILSKNTDHTYKLNIGDKSRMFDIVAHDLLRKAPDDAEKVEDRLYYQDHHKMDGHEGNSSDSESLASTLEELPLPDEFANDPQHSTDSTEDENPIIYRNLEAPTRPRRSNRIRRQVVPFQAGF